MTKCQVAWLYSNINERCKFPCISGYHQCHLYHIPYVYEDSKNCCEVQSDVSYSSCRAQNTAGVAELMIFCCLYMPFLLQ